MRLSILPLLLCPVLAQAADDRCTLNLPGDLTDDDDCLAIQVAVGPSRPIALEPVYLRLRGVDPEFTAIDSASVRHAGVNEVGAVQLVVHLHSANREFVVVDPDAIVEFSIGSLPRGKYRVSALLSSDADGGGGLGVPRPQSVFAPPAVEFDVVRKSQEPRPYEYDLERPGAPFIYNYRQAVVDFSGMWYTPAESGSGLSIEQTLTTNELIAVWNIYGPDKKPKWYMFGPGEWLAPNVYEAIIYRTEGSPVGQPFDPEDRQAELVGDGTLTFDSHGSGELAFFVDGQLIEKPIVKLFPKPALFID
jgi:hypothetical protein